MKKKQALSFCLHKEYIPRDKFKSPFSFQTFESASNRFICMSLGSGVCEVSIPLRIVEFVCGIGVWWLGLVLCRVLLPILSPKVVKLLSEWSICTVNE